MFEREILLGRQSRGTRPTLWTESEVISTFAWRPGDDGLYAVASLTTYHFHKHLLWVNLRVAKRVKGPTLITQTGFYQNMIFWMEKGCLFSLGESISNSNQEDTIVFPLSIPFSTSPQKFPILRQQNTFIPVDHFLLNSPDKTYTESLRQNREMG